MNNWSRVLSYFRPEKPRILLALLMMGLSIATNLLKPWPVAIIIDRLSGGRTVSAWGLEDTLSGAGMIGAAALAVFLLHAAQGIFAAAQNFFSIKAGLNGLVRLRQQLFSWMERLSLAFYQRRNQGDLIYRASWDTYSIQTIFQQGLFKFLNSFATVILMIVVMWRLNASLTLMTVAVFPPLIATMYFFGRSMNRRSLGAHQADSKVTGEVQQNLANIALVQSYAGEDRESARFAETVQSSFRVRISQHTLEVIYWLVIATLFGAATAGLTWWGASEIVAGRLSVGEFVIFLSYLGQLYDPLNQLSHIGATVSDANAGAQRIFEILDTKELVSEPTEPKSIPSRTGGRGESRAAVSFDNVSFGYNPNAPVLRDLSFDIASGETIGLVGPSGAGKTTLLNLVPRFYDPTAGVVRIQGLDIREISLKELRQHVAFVFQESHLLARTVAENIAYGCENVSREKIEEAARMANAHEFILRLPDGYEAQLGEGAARLSVGEKQRISIARAFLKNAPILLLDEPTSSLDVETEAMVMQSLAKLIEGRTTIMAAHRFSTLRNASRIFVLEQGRLTESGTPSDLIDSGGYFSRAANLAEKRTGETMR